MNPPNYPATNEPPAAPRPRLPPFINDLAIEESARHFHWPLGRRPHSHSELSDLGL